MTVISINKKEYEYDLRPLVRAFFPLEEVRFAEDLSVNSDPEGCRLFFSVFFDDKALLVRILCKDGKGSFKRDKSLKIPTSGDEYSPEKIETKNILKRAFYNILSEYTKKTLPWGALSGIRPIKLAMSVLNKEKDPAAAERAYMDSYLVSEEKAHLAMKIAQRQKELVDFEKLRKSFSLYVGIAFCPSRCLYCSFPSFPISVGHVEEYIRALKKEIIETAKMFRGRDISTIYIGGGTPTALCASGLDEVLSCIAENFDTKSVMEYTVEAGRPDSVTEEKLLAIKKANATRISINPQTMNQKTLDFIGRKHTTGDVREAFYLARGAGFSNINMDLIASLPNEGEDEVRHTMDEICKMAPDSITVHSLALKRSSRLGERLREGETFDTQSAPCVMEIFEEGAGRMGMEPYYLYRQKDMAGNLENTGYSLRGREGIYNILIMEEAQDIVALGAGASSKKPVFEPSGAMEGSGSIKTKLKRVERCENVKDLTNYIERVDEMIERKRRLFLE